MRLKDFEIKVIRNAVNKCFGSDAKILLFGSRVCEDKKGGDIDLLVESDQNPAESFRNKIRTLTEIQMKLGEQKIDLIVTANSEKDERLIVREAFRTGKLL